MKTKRVLNFMRNATPNWRIYIHHSCLIGSLFLDLLESLSCHGPVKTQIFYAIDLVHPIAHSKGSVIIKFITTYRAPNTAGLSDLELISSIVHSPLILLGCV